MIRSYRDLLVWQRAMALAESCYRLTGRLPSRETYGLSSQVRRCAVSVPANIAEGHARLHRGDYIRYLSIARGSLSELETLLVLSGVSRAEELHAYAYRPHQVAKDAHEVEMLQRAVDATVRGFDDAVR